MRCVGQSCGSAIANNSRFCSSCGQPLATADLPTFSGSDLPTMGETTFDAQMGSDDRTIDDPITTIAAG